MVSNSYVFTRETFLHNTNVNILLTFPHCLEIFSIVCNTNQWKTWISLFRTREKKKKKVSNQCINLIVRVHVSGVISVIVSLVLWKLYKIIQRKRTYSRVFTWTINCGNLSARFICQIMPTLLSSRLNWNYYKYNVMYRWL